jgi:hypothetical protein
VNGSVVVVSLIFVGLQLIGQIMKFLPKRNLKIKLFEIGIWELVDFEIDSLSGTYQKTKI